MGSLRLRSAALAVLGGLLLVPVAAAGPNLRIGAVEDRAIWSSSPGAEMNLARLTGYDTVRMTAQWSTGMTKLPGLQMGRIQQAAMAATQRGITPILAIYNQGASWTPADDASRQQFVRFAVDCARQLPWITTFIVGNEPNSNFYWAPQPAAGAYEQLLAATYDAIKAARPNVTIVGGALDSRGAQSPTAFIQDLGAAYRASGRTAPIMDVFDMHVYADNSTLPPSMQHTAGSAIATGDYPKLVSLLGKAFDGTGQKGSTLPILYGEFGVESAIPAAKAGAYTGTETAKTVDEATQAAYYVEALKLALCQPNVIGILDFHVTDESALAGWQSGPFYSDGSPKASFQAIHDAIAAARAGTLTKCPDQTDPTVTIQVGNGVVTAGASDDVGVGSVQLLVDGKQVDVDYTAPYTFPWTQPKKGGAVVQVRAVDAAGNAGIATEAVGIRTLSGVRGALVAGPGGTFLWRAPRSGQVTFSAPRTLQVFAGPWRIVGKQVRFAARRGVTYRLSVASLPLRWRS